MLSRSLFLVREGVFSYFVYVLKREGGFCTVMSYMKCVLL